MRGEVAAEGGRGLGQAGASRTGGSVGLLRMPWGGAQVGRMSVGSATGQRPITYDVTGVRRDVAACFVLYSLFVARLQPRHAHRIF